MLFKNKNHNIWECLEVISACLITFLAIQKLIPYLSSNFVLRDLIVYHCAILVALKGQNPYDVNLLGLLESAWYPTGYGPCPFLNPPIALLLLSLFSKISVYSMSILWNILSIVSVIWAAILIAKPNKIYSISSTIACALYNSPLLLVLHWGQLGAFMALGISLIWYSCWSINPFLFGLGITILLMKPQSYFLFILFAFYYAKKYFSLRQNILAMSFPTFSVICTIIFFPEACLGWIKSSFGSQAGTKESLFSFWSDTLGSMISYYCSFTSPNILLLFGVAGVSLLVFANIVYKKIISDRDLMIISLPLSAFLTPYGWMHDRVILCLLPLFYWRMLSAKFRIFYLLFIFLIQFLISYEVQMTGKMGAAWWFAPLCILVVIMLSKTSKSTLN